MPKELRVQMAQVGSKHYYIFEPVTLKRSIWDNLMSEHTDVVVPVYFYVYQNEVFAKCINPKIQNPSRHHRKGLSLFILANLSYHSSRLHSINIKDFKLTYVEMKLEDGSLFSEACNDQLIGRDFPFHSQ